MLISIHLRGDPRVKPNLTDAKVECIATGLEALGHQVLFTGRGDGAAGVDLAIQTGFARTPALLSAIEQEIPYLIMEAPFWRGPAMLGTYSWGYNGLAGGGFRHGPRVEERPKPALQPLKEAGSTLIIGQKPTDHSLRGADHGRWLKEQFERYPDAEFRPHPLMVPEGTLCPIDEALSHCRTVISYNSTVGAEALISGCISTPDHWGSMAYGVHDREEWLHRLSYGQYSHEEYQDPKVAAYVLEGYDEALARAEAGKQEIPRGKVNGQAICERYYRDTVSRCPTKRT